MKVSNETKVGALTSIAIVFMILGFNFLKGKSLFKTGNFIYANFSNTKNIMISNPVLANGFTIGTVYDIENTDASLKTIRVAIKLKDKYDIPDNSVAAIDPSLMGTSTIVITLGDSKKFVENGGEIKSVDNAGLLAGLQNSITPVADQLKNTTKTLDSVLRNINSVFDANAKNNLQSIIGNINKITASLITTSASLEKLMADQTGTIGESMKNLNSFSKNLAANNETITKTMNNLEKTTTNLSGADLSGTVSSLKGAVDRLNGVMNKLDSKEGSLGMLMNDKTLYTNLNNTVRSANILIDDLKTHPKRYLNVSVFGKKDKSTPLSAPLNDSISKKP